LGTIQQDLLKDLRKTFCGVLALKFMMIIKVYTIY
jgi:hypothetical protein